MSTRSNQVTTEPHPAVKGSTLQILSQKTGFGIAYTTVGDAVLRFLLTAFLGAFGVHKFASRKIGQGILYLCTAGLLYVGWAFDSISALVSVVRTALGCAPKSTAFSDGNSQLPAAQSVAAQTPELTADTISAVPIDLSNLSPMDAELARIDAMSVDGHAFEHYCADLMRKIGYKNVEVTAGSGDFGIDILAEKDSVTYAVQCKCYSHPVGNKAVQEAFSGKEYYRRMVGVVVTNNSFTSAAVKTAAETRVLLWDRNKLREMIEDAKPELVSAGAEQM